MNIVLIWNTVNKVISQVVLVLTWVPSNQTQKNKQKCSIGKISMSQIMLGVMFFIVFNILKRFRILWKIVRSHYCISPGTINKQLFEKKKKTFLPEGRLKKTGDFELMNMIVNVKIFFSSYLDLQKSYSITTKQLPSRHIISATHTC